MVCDKSQMTRVDLNAINAENVVHFLKMVKLLKAYKNNTNLYNNPVACLNSIVVQHYINVIRVQAVRIQQIGMLVDGLKQIVRNHCKTNQSSTNV